MSAEVSDVLPRLAVIQREILSPTSGSAIYAYDNVPNTIDMGTMPLFVNLVGPLTNSILISSESRVGWRAG